MKVMGIDIGTTTISMVLTEADTGKMIAKETVEHRSFLKSEIPEQKIQDPERIYEIVTELANQMEKEYGLPDGIGFTGQMPDCNWLSDGILVLCADSKISYFS